MTMSCSRYELAIRAILAKHVGSIRIRNEKKNKTRESLEEHLAPFDDICQSETPPKFLVITINGHKYEIPLLIGLNNDNMTESVRLACKMGIVQASFAKDGR